MESFSTRGLVAARKVAYWNALNSEAFAAMEITPRDAASFDGELRREPVGSLTVMDVQSAAVRIRHSRTHIARVDSPSYLLLAPLSGEFQLRLDREAPQRVGTGQFCLLDHAQPYELQHGDAVRVICLDMPRPTLEALLPRPQAAVGRILRGDTSPARLLSSVLRGLGSEFGPAAAARFAPGLAQGLLGFVAAAYSEDADALPATAEARRLAILAQIDSRLHEPDLSPLDIAVTLRLSTRRLRALLAPSGETFSAYVLRRRLERCAERLRDAQWRTLSITEIAFRNGFNNATHFGYAFRQRYDMTPRDYRAQR